MATTNTSVPEPRRSSARRDASSARAAPARGRARRARCDRLDGVATAKAERLLNLVIALVNSPRYRSAAWIREKVAGYADAPTTRRSSARSSGTSRSCASSASRCRPRRTARTATASRRSSSRCRRCPSHPRRPPRSRWPAGSGRPRRWRAPAPGRCARSGTRRTHRRRTRHPPADRRAESGAAHAAAATGAHRRSRLRAAARGGPGPPRRHVRLPQGPAGGGRAAGAAALGAGVLHGRWYVIGYDESAAERRTFRVSRIAGPVRARRPRGRGVAARRRRPAGRGGGKRRAGRRPHGDAADPRRSCRRAAPDGAHVGARRGRSGAGIG